MLHTYTEVENKPNSISMQFASSSDSFESRKLFPYSSTTATYETGAQKQQLIGNEKFFLKLFAFC